MMRVSKTYSPALELPQRPIGPAGSHSTDMKSPRSKSAEVNIPGLDKREKELNDVV